MKRLLSVFLAVLLLGAGAMGAGAAWAAEGSAGGVTLFAPGVDDLTPGQLAEILEIVRYYQLFYDFGSTSAIPVNCIVSLAMVLDDAHIDTSNAKRFEFYEKVNDAIIAVRTTAAFYALFSEGDEEAVVAAYFAGTLKADLEKMLDDCLAEHEKQLRPLVNAYLKPEFIPFAESYAVMEGLFFAILCSNLSISQQGSLTGEVRALANASDWPQLAEQGQWAQAKTGLDAMNAAARQLLIDAGVLAPATFTVAYNANGGTGAPAAQTKTEGVALVLRTAVPTRDGHTFNGWAASATGAVVFQPGANYTADADITLFAVWEKNQQDEHFWDSWPSFVQLILRIVFFGWLWMRWF